MKTEIGYEKLNSDNRADAWRLRRWILGFAFWTLLGLSFASRTYLSYYREGISASWRQILASFLVDFYLWGAASPLIFWLCRRFPIERERIFSNAGLHFFFCIIFTFGITAISIPTVWYLGYPNVGKYSTLQAFFADSILSPYLLHQGLLVYWTTLVVAHAFEYYRQNRVGEKRAAELSVQLAQSQLAALKMQIHPHFLFNTLNSIAALLHEDVEAADLMVARLSDFLRLTLRNSDESSTTLEKELEFLRIYLEIEKIRFQSRLVVDMKIAPETLDAQVPNLILQPIVENAVKHGIARQKAAGHLQIFACLRQDRLLIKIEDNGPGLQKNGNVKGNGHKGVGLANTRARLKQFYDGDFQFEIVGKENPNGTIVTVEVPYII